jgi:hypothetical protein
MIKGKVAEQTMSNNIQNSSKKSKRRYKYYEEAFQTTDKPSMSNRRRLFW